jgi:hypothetical protein
VINVLFAQGSDLLVGKGIAMILFFGAVGLFSTVASFVTNETLKANWTAKVRRGW